jgi:hypothetical protein
MLHSSLYLFAFSYTTWRRRSLSPAIEQSGRMQGHSGATSMSCSVVLVQGQRGATSSASASQFSRQARLEKARLEKARYDRYAI